MCSLRITVPFLYLFFASLAVAQPVDWFRTYDTRPDLGIPGDHASEFVVDVVPAPDGGFLVQGGYYNSIYDNEFFPSLTKLDSGFNLEWSRAYEPVRFVNRQIHALPGGKYLIAGDYRPTPTAFVPFLAVVDEYGFITRTHLEPYQPDVWMRTFVPLSAGGFAVLLQQGEWENTTLLLKRLDMTGETIWTNTIDGAFHSLYSEVLETPDGNIALIDSRNRPIIHVFDIDGNPLNQATIDPGYNLYTEEAVIQADGSLYLAGEIVHDTTFVLKVSPDLQLLEHLCFRKQSLRDMLATSDGGLLLTGNHGWLRKFDSDLTVEWDIDQSSQVEAEALCEFEPGVYALMGRKFRMGLIEEFDLYLRVIGMDEPDPPALKMYLYQRWDEPLSIPASGATVEFLETVSNTWNVPQTVDQWTQLRLPRGVMHDFLPVTRVFEPGETEMNRSVEVPASAAPGDYVYVWHVGTWPDDIVSSSSIIVRKRPAGSALDLFLAANDAGVLYPDRDPVSAAVDLTSEPKTPQAFTLSAAYPNPFNASTVLDLTLPETEHVRIVVADILGRQVEVLRDDVMAAGTQRISLHAGQLASGLYFVTAATQSGHHTVQKVMLLR